MRTFVQIQIAALLCLAPVLARAETPNAGCEIRVVHARPGGQGIDPRITRLRPYLEKPPFTSWKRFDLIEQRDVTLTIGTPTKVDLPNGKVASLTYVDHLKNTDGPHRLELRLEIGTGNKKLLDTTFVLDAGGVVLQAGQKYKDGLLILGFTCDVHHDHP